MRNKDKLFSLAIALLILILTMVYIAGAAPFAYITTGNNTVSVIDIATSNVTVTVPVGIAPYGVTVSPDGSKVYIANRENNTVSVINTVTNNIMATVLVGSNPLGVVVTPDGTKAYVTNEISNNVSVIDTVTNNVIATVPVGLNPFGVVVTPDGTKAFVANSGGNVSVIDTATNNVTNTVLIPECLIGVAVTPDGTKVYVANVADDTVYVINSATNNVITTINVGDGPYEVAINRNGTRAYVSNIFSDDVSVIDTATNNVIDTVPVGTSPRGIAVTPDETRVYVSNNNNNTVSVIDTATNNVIDTVPVGTSPIAFGQFITPILTGLTLNKSASSTTYSTVGQVITYTYNVTNSGAVGISGPISISDNVTGIIQISNIGLAPGQSATGTGTYTIKQTDITAGSVTNSATATGTFNGNTVTSNQVTATVTAIQNPALTITKTATPSSYNAVGNRITYRYTITNTGNVPVSSIEVTDNKTTVLFSSGVLINGNLAPGSRLGGVGSYTIKQADITAGSVTNSATAAGKLNGNTVTSNQATVTVKYNK